MTSPSPIPSFTPNTISPLNTTSPSTTISPLSSCAVPLTITTLLNPPVLKEVVLSTYPFYGQIGDYSNSCPDDSWVPMLGTYCVSKSTLPDGYMPDPKNPLCGIPIPPSSPPPSMEPSLPPSLPPSMESSLPPSIEIFSLPPFMESSSPPPSMEIFYTSSYPPLSTAYN